MRRTKAYTVIALALTVGLVGAPTASGARRDDPRRERDRVRARQLEVASGLDVMKADLGQLDAALAALGSNVARQERLSARADQDVADSGRKAERAAHAVEQATARLAVLRKKMTRRAVAAYVSPPADAAFDLLQMKDFGEVDNRRMYDELQASNDADLADTYAGASKDLQADHRTARAALAEVRAKRAEQRKRTLAVRAAHGRQRRFSATLSRRINVSVSESIRLATTDRALSTRIALEQAAIAARIAEQQAAERARAAAAERARAAAAAAAARRDAAAAASRAAARTPSRPRARRPAAPTERTAAAPVKARRTGTGNIGLSTVGGITVNAQIGGQLGALLDAARSDGVSLSGGGYRDPAEQVSLRQSHCGSSHYAIYEMSAGSCDPPTAIPGNSMHEVGLAIDFENCGSRSTSCWQWLSANASRFGFHNLPSEPWHWSINGS